MDTKELIKKVRKIEIKTKGLTSQIFSGEYHSAFKGKGMSFREVRNYSVGDEVRTIDWNVTARFNEPFVKVFEEERELTVMLLVDVSNSGMFGTANQLKRETITELCAVLAFSASSNKDRIGVIFFSDQIEKYIPPKKGKSHILRIIRELINIKPVGKSTDLSQALKYFSKMQKKRCTAFILSDFRSNNFQDAIKIAAKKHDLIALKFHDKTENEIPDIGLANFYDLESGKTVLVQTFFERNRIKYKEKQDLFNEKTKEIFKKSNVDFAEIDTENDYIKPLLNLFKRRA